MLEIVWPGTHRVVQKELIANPETQQPSPFCDDLIKSLTKPYEFVAEAGDVLFMHHLVLHEGNKGHSANRKPRIALCCDAWRGKWVTEIDPTPPNLPPWQRSLALNGKYKAVYDERAERAKICPELQAEIAEESVDR